MRVHFSSEARQDLIVIGDYIAQNNPARTLSFVGELIDRRGSLSETLLRYPVLPRYEARAIRRCVHGNYQIFYLIDGDAIHVVRVLHGARDYEALL